MDLTEVIEKYSYKDYNEEVDGNLYDYYVNIKIPSNDLFDTIVRAMSGEQIDERLRELIVSLGSRELCDGAGPTDGTCLFYIPLLIRNREGFEEALEVVSEYPYFNGLECHWTRVMAFKKEDYVHPLPR